MSLENIRKKYAFYMNIDSNVDGKSIIVYSMDLCTLTGTDSEAISYIIMRAFHV